ncbi:MAG: O-antigen ligase family protein [Bacilli bacterium]|nr:O-antigen ligase family protein [Bacilli bacterium]
MLVQLFPKLNDLRLIYLLKKGMNSIWMIVTIILFAALSNIFGLELFAYYFYMLLVMVVAMLNDDMLPTLPIACIGYMTFSKKSNPLALEQTSAFLENATIIQLTIIAIIIAIFAISRLVFDIIKIKERRTIPKLLYGYIALGIAYMLGGLFSEYYSFKTFFFGLIQILSISLFYFYFYYTIDWKKVSKDYFPMLFTLVGVLMVFEISNMLIDAGALNFESGFKRSLLYTGWGHYNNVACMCILTLPAPFYFAITKKNGWIYSLLGSLFFIFIILNQSRNGILMSSIIYITCVITTLILTKGKERIKNIITFSILVLLLLIVVITFKEKIINIFASLLKAGIKDSGRFKIYIEGFKQYLDNPILGNGFYECGAKRWGVPYDGGFLPGRYHNTYIQILASCGSIGILAYIYHKYQIFKNIYKNKNIGNLIIFITIIGYALICLLDCHFHNFGPGLMYSILLLFSEKLYIKEKGLN